MTVTAPLLDIRLRSSVDHLHQAEFVDSMAKRIVVRAGRRGGKTVGAATRAVKRFMTGRRQLYAAPVTEQTDAFWFEVKRALVHGIDLGCFKVNESERFIEVPNTKQRIKCKTAWNADTLRGDYADDLILDEWQLMDEDTWEVVGAPMLVDHNGDAVFIYTPPSLRSAGVSKARDPRHAAKMFKMAQADTTGRWKAFHFTSHDNPFISQVALGELIKDMSRQSYRQEILAEDDDIQLSWLVYRVFNEDRRKVKRFEIPMTWPVSSGHDFGQANPAALFFAQVRLPLPSVAPPEMRVGDWVAWHEYLPGGGSIYTHSEDFKRIVKGYEVYKRVGGNQNSEDQIRQGHAAHGWPITAPLITQPKHQIDRVVGLMELNKIWVFDDLYHYLEELLNCLWEPDNEGRPTDKIKDEAKYHLCACARHLMSDFTPETVYSEAGSKPVSNH